MSRLPRAGRGEPIDCDVSAVLDHWVEAGPWWRRFDSGTAIVQQHRWRVESQLGRRPVGVYDLGWDEAANRWVLARVND